MAFVRNSTNTIEIPHEPGNTVTIRRPRRGLLVAAADTRQEKALQRVRALGGASFLAEMRAAQAPDQSVTEVPPAAPVAEASAPTPAQLAASFDQDALLLAGIVSWAGPEYDDTAVDADAIADLDPITATFLAEAIASYAATGATQKND
jgi:hypothetical protein